MLPRLPSIICFLIEFCWQEDLLHPSFALSIYLDLTSPKILLRAATALTYSPYSTRQGPFTVAVWRQ